MPALFNQPDIGVFIVFVVLIVVTARVIKAVLENRTKRMLIEKGPIDESAKYIFSNYPESFSPSLKWGLVLVAMGLAVLTGQLFPKELQNVITFGGMLIFAGLALIGYYIIALKIQQGNKHEGGIR